MRNNDKCLAHRWWQQQQQPTSDAKFMTELIKLELDIVFTSYNAQDLLGLYQV